MIKDGTEPHTGGVAVHDERPVEVRHLKNGTHGEGPLKSLERSCRLLIPGKGVAT